MAESEIPGGTVPKTGTKRWVKNEKIINENPVLKQARDIQQGLDKPAHRYGSGGSITMSGAGDSRYAENWEKIFGGDRKNVNHKEDE